MAEIETKKCSKCKEEKPLNLFNRCSSKLDGFYPWCKLCKKQAYPYVKTSISTVIGNTKNCPRCENRRSLDEFQKDKSQPSGLNTYCRECVSYQQKQKRGTLEIIYCKEENCSIEITTRNKTGLCKKHYRQELNKLRYAENRDAYLSYAKEYRKLNIDRIRKYQQEYSAEQHRNNEQYKISLSIRNRVRAALLIQLEGREMQTKSSATKSLGCPIEDFLIYIEKRFVDNMTWDNYGEWHLDHIIPLSSFDLQDSKQFNKACHFTNYQPLWASENRSKNNKSPEEWKAYRAQKDS